MSNGPCNACATNASARCVSVRHHHLNAPYNAACVTLRLAKIILFAAAPVEWPGEAAADQHPLAVHLQHQTGSRLTPPAYLRIKGASERS